MTGLAQVQGHWFRHWIKAPGFEDHTTRVHWMQAGAVYADVRIPLTRPDVAGAHGLADLPAASLRALAGAEGFAGHVSFEGDHCTWHREINWHGTPEGLDVGHIAFDDRGRMIETGVLAEYTELWEQRAQAKPTALRFGNGAYAGVLVVAGAVAVLGIGRPEKAPTGPVITALDQGHIPEQVGAAFDGVHALCSVSAGQVRAVLCTDPLQEGQTLLTLGETGVIWHRVGFDGTRVDMDLPAATVPA